MYCANGIAEKIRPLFDGFDDSVIYSYFDGICGNAYCDSLDIPSFAVITAGDFIFTAGDCSHAAEAVKLAGNNRYATFIPENLQWAKALAEEDDRLFITERFHTTCPEGGFDSAELENRKGKISQFPEYRLEQINEAYYNQALEEDWSASFVNNFKDYREFSHHGFGFVITHNGKIISGTSCYTYYKGGVEIEVATDENYRGKGLAKICASAFILECLKRSLKPHWDARNKASLCIAKKMGFVYKDTYTALEFDQNRF